MNELTFLVLALVGFIVLGLTLLGVSLIGLVVWMLLREWKAYADEWETLDGDEM